MKKIELKILNVYLVGLTSKAGIMVVNQLPYSQMLETINPEDEDFVEIRGMSVLDWLTFLDIENFNPNNQVTFPQAALDERNIRSFVVNKKAIENLSLINQVKIME